MHIYSISECFMIEILFSCSAQIDLSGFVVYDYVTINYVNLCFSFLLSGLSLTVILWGKKVFAGNSEAFYLYGFLLALWIFLAAVAMIYPCPPESNVWMSYGQLSGSVLVCLLLIVPFIRVASTRKNQKK